jgi:uncharacterized protein YkwD
MTRQFAHRRPSRAVSVYAAAALVALYAASFAAPSAHAAAYDWLLAPTTKCGGGNQTNTSLSTSDQEKVMQCLHNFARRRAGRRVLYGNSLLYRSSDAKTADMLRCRQFSHTACGYNMQYRFDWVGYTTGGCWGWGENIAWGTGGYGSPRATMRAWLNSAPHRDNILNPSFVDTGFGVRKGTFLGHRGAEVWTAHFGYRC